VRIGLVTDVASAAQLLRRALALTPEHRVLWTATSGRDAVALCVENRPDVVLIDLLASSIAGTATTKAIMASAPCPILILTGRVQASATRVFEAIGSGALDAVDMPASASGDLSTSARPLFRKLAAMARLIGDAAVPARSVVARVRRLSASGPCLVAIGASAGGPAAVATVLRALPENFHAAIVVIQHVDERFADGMAKWLGQQTALTVRVAVEGDRPAAGTVLLSGASNHLVFKTMDCVGYTADACDYIYRPSVDVFFQSLTHHWQRNAAGVLLTGMGRDGAVGLRALRNEGHYTIAQDEASSAVYGMPKAAARLNAAVHELPIDRIAPYLIDYVARGT
jgi:two-component system response regulator WspF